LESRWGPLFELADTLGDETACGLTHRPSVVSDPSAATAVVLQALEARSPSSVPPDDIVLGDEVGRGGMGVVHRATQTSLARQVAVKRLLPSAELRAPFLSEAQVLGRLEHPNIVPVHVLRTGDDGEPLCAMKLVEGASWDELLHAQEHSIVDHLRILISVCNAVAFAHSRGIIHRDIKPANVMVGSFAQVYLMDWGLAVALDEGISRDTSIVHRAQADAPAGTPGYMAPELVRGDGLSQDERTDVYLLGGCLHEMLVRRRRHEGPTMRAVLQSALSSEPFAYPADAPAELAAIANRATAADPAERFASADAFREALEAYLDHRQAHALLDEASALLAQLREASARYDGSEQSGRVMHQQHAEVRFALQHAARLWPEAPDVNARMREAGVLMLEHALRTEDVALAERTLAEHGDDDMRAQVEAMKERNARTRHELDALREAARKRDWSIIAAPIGSAFIVAGVMGGTAALATRVIGVGERPLVMMIWLSVAVLSALVAFVLLRGRDVPANLASPRMIGLWATVALACVVSGAASYAEGRTMFANAAAQSQFMAIGFAAMAMHTRRWLLVPAAAFMLGSLAMPPSNTHNIEIFGALWLATMAGVGIALKLGATLAEPDVRQ